MQPPRASSKANDPEIVTDDQRAPAGDGSGSNQAERSSRPPGFGDGGADLIGEGDSGGASSTPSSFAPGVRDPENSAATGSTRGARGPSVEGDFYIVFGVIEDVAAMLDGQFLPGRDVSKSKKLEHMSMAVVTSSGDPLRIRKSRADDPRPWPA